ncbi:Gp19/Gp15/Gp42 family protein [Bifidobacterium olomucense]|uniref:Phage protein Gp19/Gp15/Gp42 n=1 Tax=Bifidobacterium olomucense TaxID=2675324 RepID=A0A7Y0HXF4_9BIFI|nr:Gp19/Gp15/Gp42 family protein [Bifidobacterium sp. DSM 109959]NMM99331.1 phage protein Gp19/Gp15/Gp42 [Bifidobacterium sp. DSM 109959]
MGDDIDTPVDPGMQVPSPPFALVADLEKRWHTLSDAEKLTAETLIEDASDKIMTDCPRWTEASEATLRRITCQMVKRAMLNPDMAGVSQGTQTANGFTESLSYSNPDGDLYLTAQERRSLGCGVQRMWSIDLANGETSL